VKPAFLAPKIATKLIVVCWLRERRGGKGKDRGRERRWKRGREWKGEKRGERGRGRAERADKYYISGTQDCRETNCMLGGYYNKLDHNLSHNNLSHKFAT
jgi:hypothetical protein